MRDSGLGARQRRLIALMARFGGGAWPPGWWMHSREKKLLDSLARRGIVTGSGIEARLTGLGLEIAAAETV